MALTVLAKIRSRIIAIFNTHNFSDVTWFLLGLNTFLSTVPWNERPISTPVYNSGYNHSSEKTKTLQNE
jgi:outer membrane protein assembly factor BamA